MGKRTLGDDAYEGSESKKGALDWKKSGKKLTFYKPEQGNNNKIIIVPYEIKTKNHPRVKAGKAKVGNLDFILDVWVHKSIGPSKQDVICPKRTFNGMCPLCDQAQEYYESEQKREYDAIKAKHRAYYNVIDMNNPDKGIQIFDASYALFQEELADAAKDASEDGRPMRYADPDEGKGIKFKAYEDTLGKTKFNKFKNFSFVGREDMFEEGMIDDTISFDECMVLFDAEAISKMMYGTEEEDEDDEEEAPPKPRTQHPKAVKKDDDEDDLVDDEEDEKPAPRKSDKAEKADDDTPKCIGGGKFGKDTDKFDECDGDCKHYRACLRAKQGK